MIKAALKKFRNGARPEGEGAAQDGGTTPTTPQRTREQNSASAHGAAAGVTNGNGSGAKAPNGASAVATQAPYSSSTTASHNTKPLPALVPAMASTSTPAAHEARDMALSSSTRGEASTAAATVAPVPQRSSAAPVRSDAPQSPARSPASASAQAASAPSASSRAASTASQRSSVSSGMSSAESSSGASSKDGEPSSTKHSSRRSRHHSNADRNAASQHPRVPPQDFKDAPPPTDPSLMALHTRVEKARRELDESSPTFSPTFLQPFHTELQEISDIFMRELEVEVGKGESSPRFEWLVQKACVNFFCLAEEFYGFLAVHRANHTFFGQEVGELVPFLGLQAAVARELYIEAANMLFGYKKGLLVPGQSLHESFPVVRLWMRPGGPSELIHGLLHTLAEQEDSCLLWYASHVNLYRMYGTDMLTYAYLLNRRDDAQVTMVRMRMNSMAHEEDFIVPWLEQIRREVRKHGAVSTTTQEGYRQVIRDKYDLLLKPIEGYLPLPLVFNKNTLYVVDTRHAVMPSTVDPHTRLAQARWLPGFMDKAGFLAMEKWAVTVAPAIWTVLLSAWQRHQVFLEGSAEEKLACMSREPYGTTVRPAVTRNFDFGEKTYNEFFKFFNANLLKRRVVCIAEATRNAIVNSVDIHKEPWLVLGMTINNYGSIIRPKDDDDLTEEHILSDQHHRDFEEYCQSHGIYGLLEGMVADIVVKRPRAPAAVVDRLLLYVAKHELPLRTMVAGATKTTPQNPAIMLPPRSTPRKNYTPLQHVHFMQMRPVGYRHNMRESAWEAFFQRLLNTPNPFKDDGSFWRPGPVTFWAPKRISPFDTESSLDDDDGDMILLSFLPALPGDSAAEVPKVEPPQLTDKEEDGGPTHAAASDSAAESRLEPSPPLASEAVPARGVAPHPPPESPSHPLAPRANTPDSTLPEEIIIPRPPTPQSDSLRLRSMYPQRGPSPGLRVSPDPEVWLRASSGGGRRTPALVTVPEDDDDDNETDASQKRSEQDKYDAYDDLLASFFYEEFDLSLPASSTHRTTTTTTTTTTPGMPNVPAPPATPRSVRTASPAFPSPPSSLPPSPANSAYRRHIFRPAASAPTPSTDYYFPTPGVNRPFSALADLDMMYPASTPATAAAHAKGATNAGYVTTSTGFGNGNSTSLGSSGSKGLSSAYLSDHGLHYPYDDFGSFEGVGNLSDYHSPRMLRVNARPRSTNQSTSAGSSNRSNSLATRSTTSETPLRRAPKPQSALTPKPTATTTAKASHSPNNQPASLPLVDAMPSTHSTIDACDVNVVAAVTPNSQPPPAAASAAASKRDHPPRPTTESGESFYFMTPPPSPLLGPVEPPVMDDWATDDSEALRSQGNMGGMFSQDINDYDDIWNPPI